MTCITVPWIRHTAKCRTSRRRRWGWYRRCGRKLVPLSKCRIDIWSTVSFYLRQRIFFRLYDMCIQNSRIHKILTVLSSFLVSLSPCRKLPCSQSTIFHPSLCSAPSLSTGIQMGRGRYCGKTHRPQCCNRSILFAPCNPQLHMYTAHRLPWIRQRWCTPPQTQ